MFKGGVTGTGVTGTAEVPRLTYGLSGELRKMSQVVGICKYL